MVDIGYELLEDCYDEVIELTKAQMRESIKELDDVIPRREQAEDQSRRGYFRVYTLRDGKKLVGHFALTIGANVRDSYLRAYEEFVYILPEYRGKYFNKLHAFVKDDLRLFGVKDLYFMPSIESNLGKLLELKGLELVSQTYRERL